MTSQGKSMRPTIRIPNEISCTEHKICSLQLTTTQTFKWRMKLSYLSHSENNGKVTPSLQIAAGAFLLPILIQPANFPESWKFCPPGNQQPCRNTYWHLLELPKVLQKQDSKQLGAAGSCVPASGRMPTQLRTLCKMTGPIYLIVQSCQLG